MKLGILTLACTVFLGACSDIPLGISRNRVVEIGNETGVAMTSFYASNTGRDTWEEDIFDGEPLRTGNSINVDIDDGSGACRFDMRAEFADGDKVVSKGFNVCTQGTWIVR
jgi:hypothetical protein